MLLLIADYLGLDASDLTPEARFDEDLGCDRLDIIEIIVAIEEDLDIELADDDDASITTVGDLLGAVERLTKAPV